MNDEQASVLTSLASRLNRSPLLKNTSISFVLRISGAGLLFTFNWLIVRSLGIAGSGIFFLAVTIVNILSTACLIGIDQYTLRTIAANPEAESNQATFSNNGGLVVTVSLIGSLFLVLVSGYLSHVFKSPSLKNVLVIMALCLPLLNLTTYLGGVMQAKRKFASSVYILTNSQYVAVIPLMFGFYVLGKTSLFGLAWLFLISLVIANVINVALSYRTYWQGFTLSPPGLLKSFRNVIHSSHQLFWTSMLGLSFGGVDILLVGHLSTTTNVSIYTIASKVAKLLTFSLFAINTTVAPAISKYFNSGDMKNLNKELQKATLISILFSLPLLLIFLAFPGLLLGLFGHGYVAGVGVLRLLVIGQTINAFTGAMSVTMIMIKQERALNLLSFLVLVFQIVVSFILIPRYGINGAGIATALSMSIVNILGVVYLAKYHHIKVIPSLSTTADLVRGQ